MKILGGGPKRLLRPSTIVLIFLKARGRALSLRAPMCEIQIRKSMEASYVMLGVRASW